jgi:Fe2+ or Zn2+ uptake regulation protein
MSAKAVSTDQFIIALRGRKEAPHGWCHGCDITPLVVMRYNDTDHKVCPDCEPTWLEDNIADDKSDNESVHSTCCMDCEESFEFDEPVSAEDYADGNHEMRCTKCRAKHNGVQRYMTAFGRAPPDFIEPVMNACEDSILTAKQIVASLKATYPDITKTAVNSILYKALTKGLVVKHEHENAPPTWTWSE